MHLNKKTDYSLFNFVSQVNSSLKKRSQYVDIISSKLVVNILDLLTEHGCINGFRFLESCRKVRVFFKYCGGKSVITSLKTISKPSRRVFWGVETVLRYSKNKGLGGFYVISTSKGLYVNQDLYTLKKPISGEIMLYIKI